MTFDLLYGQNRVKKIFEAALSGGRLAHAYCFHGQAGVGKDAMALSLAMDLNCIQKERGGCGTCPSCHRVLAMDSTDFRMVLPFPRRLKTTKEDDHARMVRDLLLRRVSNPYHDSISDSQGQNPPTIGIDQIRELIGTMMLKTFEGRTRVVLVSHADRMTQEAANSLLKLLEEPPPKTILILTTAVPKQLPLTILSRCQMVRFDPLSDGEIEKALIKQWTVPLVQARLASRLSGGSLHLALESIGENLAYLRDGAIGFLQACLENDTAGRIGRIDEMLDRWTPPEIGQCLRILALWLRDLFQLQSGRSDRIFNTDCSERLAQFQTRWPRIDIRQGMRHVDHAIDNMEKNVYLPLFLLSLGLNLSKCSKA